MKTETAIVLVVLIIGGVAAYKIFSKQTTAANAQPLGANVGTLNAAASIASALPSFIGGLENVFGGSGSNGGAGTSNSYASDGADAYGYLGGAVGSDPLDFSTAMPV